MTKELLMEYFNVSRKELFDENCNDNNTVIENNISIAKMKKSWKKVEKN